MICLAQKYTVRKAGAILLILVGVFAITFSADAGSLGLSIQPLKVTHTLKPGEEVSGAILIKNASDDAVNVETNMQDFVPLAGTYEVQIVQRAPGVSTVRDWITLEAPKSFTLGKGAEKNVAYTIKAPPDAEPGGHFGVILFKATELKEGQQLKVGTQVGMLVLVTVPGSRLEKGKVLEFSGPLFVKKSPIDFIIKFENTGTVHFEPKGTITIINIFGKEVDSVPVGGQVVLPTGVRDLVASVNFDGVLAGRYKAVLKIFDGEGNIIAEKTHAFYAFPLWYALAFIASVAILFFGIRFLKKNLNISISRK